MLAADRSDPLCWTPMMAVEVVGIDGLRAVVHDAACTVGGCSMPDHGSSHEDHDETSCPFCTGDVPAEIVDRIMKAAAGPMSEAMSAEEFRAWLDRFDLAR